MSIEQIIQQARDAKNWLTYRLAAKEIKKAFTTDDTQTHSTARIAFLSSFTIEPLVDFVTVEAAEEKIAIDAYVAGYNLYNQEILSAGSDLYQFSPEITFLIVEADKNFTLPQIKSLADAFKQKNDGLLVVTNFIASPQWPLHIIADEQMQALRKTNQQLEQAFIDDSQVQILDIDSLAAYLGFSRAISPEMLHMARIPFSESFLSLLAKKILSYIKTHKNLARKCLVLDCDNTLWGGIIGEDGIEGIHLGPDSPGREFVDFQKAILQLHNQGVILAINSKNNHDDVMEVLQNHPHMILRENHFAGIQINWLDKPSNMRRLGEEINIGLDSFVFIDDNPAECAMMRQLLPQIHTMEMPANPSLYARTLRESNEFAKAYLTDEDRKRGQIYAAQRQRQKLEAAVGTLEDFLKSLQMTASIRKAKQADVKRIAQLTQRTNQFNLTTQRYSEADIKNILNAKDRAIYVLSLKDKFGDNGTVALAIIAKQDKTWQIDTFLMSCRAIGRNIESALADRILTDAAAEAIETVQAQYIQTAKNDLAADFWQKMGFEKTDSDAQQSTWQCNLSDYKPKNFEYLRLES